MNHVPDDTLAAIDAFGEGWLRGDPPAVTERLRSDLRLRIRPIGDGVARCRFEIDGGRAPPTLRERGSFVETIVDGVDERLTAWGVDPPPAYEHVESVGGSHRYAGRVRFP